jgi:hypothetical protein
MQIRAALSVSSPTSFFGFATGPPRCDRAGCAAARTSSESLRGTVLSRLAGTITRAIAPRQQLRTGSLRAAPPPSSACGRSDYSWPNTGR